MKKTMLLSMFFICSALLNPLLAENDIGPKPPIITEGNAPIDEDLALFLSLPFTQEDEFSLRTFNAFLIGKNLEDIIANRDTIEPLFVKFDSIHPLRSFGFIFSDPNMRQQTHQLLQVELLSEYVYLMLETELKKIMTEPLFPQKIHGLEIFLHLEDGTIMKFIEEEEYTELFEFLCFTA